MPKTHQEGRVREVLFMSENIFTGIVVFFLGSEFTFTD